MRTLTKQILTGLFFLLAVVSTAAAQEVRRDTLRLEVFFRTGVSEVDPSFRENGARMAQFREALQAVAASPDAKVQQVVVRSGCSPEGSAALNERLSEARAQSIRDYLAGQLGTSADLFRVISGGENWEGLVEHVERLDVPWKQDVLSIVRDKDDPEERKRMLKLLDDGRVWSWLDAHVFPDLRSVGGGVACVVERPATEVIPEPGFEVEPEEEAFPTHRDTVYVKQRPDTVFVTVTPDGTAASKGREYDLTGRRFLFALRTNAIAIPFANVGVEIPLGEHWSMGADWYYPWLWRPHHVQGLDYSGNCNELLALDLEARYWFANRHKKPEQRLLGHSLGVYAAAGYYDFERNWTGHQGEFLNVGVDYLYAVPIFRGHAHLEFELGVGYIYSPAQPYDTFVEGEKAYRRKGIKRYVRWFGPTRAQASLTIPIYSKRKGGEK